MMLLYLPLNKAILEKSAVRIFWTQSKEEKEDWK